MLHSGCHPYSALQRIVYFVKSRIEWYSWSMCWLLWQLAASADLCSGELYTWTLNAVLNFFRGLARNLVEGGDVLTSHCNFKTRVNVHVNKTIEWFSLGGGGRGLYIPIYPVARTVQPMPWPVCLWRSWVVAKSLNRSRCHFAETSAGPRNIVLELIRYPHCGRVRGGWNFCHNGKDRQLKVQCWISRERLQLRCWSQWKSDRKLYMGFWLQTSHLTLRDLGGGVKNYFGRNVGIKWPDLVSHPCICWILVTLGVCLQICNSNTYKHL